MTTLDRTAASQFGVLTKLQLLALGWSPDQIKYRVKTGWLRQTQGGVYALAGVPDSWEQRCCAAALAANPLGAASHRSAGRLWGFRTVDDEVEVAVRYPRHLTLDGAIVHRSRDLVRSDLTVVNGIPTTTPERTICDLGLIFPRAEVRRILQHAIATGLVNRYDLFRIRYRNGRQGRSGVGHLGAVLDELPVDAERAESGPEVAFVQLCAEVGLPTPVLQLPVVIAGRHYRLDFAYPESRVFVEIDGTGSHTGATQIAADDGRQNDLVAAGWTPLRFTSTQLVSEPGRCVASIRRTLRSVTPTGQ